MNIITKTSNLIYSIRLYRNPNLITSDFNLRLTLNVTQKSYPSKNNIVRNLVASSIKRYREINPFQPQDYSEAKALYDAYFQMENHIPTFATVCDEVYVGKKVYVTCFRDEVPVKGKRFCEYYINGCYGIQRVFLLTQVSECGSYIRMDDPDGFANVSSISRDSFTNFRYSTPEEIEKFESAKEQIVILKKQADEKQIEVSRIWKQINDLKKFSK